MYGMVLCTECQRPRIADLHSETSSCPYCGRTDVIDKMAVLFRDKDQNAVRNAIGEASSSKYPEQRKKGDDPDPLSTLVYEYERTSGVVAKLTVLANGLTRIRGEFSEKDVNELFPDDGERLLKQMVSCDIVIELHHGTYKAV